MNLKINNVYLKYFTKIWNAKQITGISLLMDLYTSQLAGAHNL